jgi:hypothetical protein
MSDIHRTLMASTASAAQNQRGQSQPAQVTPWVVGAPEQSRLPDAAPDGRPVTADCTSELLVELEAAEVMRLSPRTLQQWRVQGRGPPFIRLGRAIRYRRSAIAEYLAAHTAASTTEADAAREAVR